MAGRDVSQTSEHEKVIGRFKASKPVATHGSFLKGPKFTRALPAAHTYDRHSSFDSHHQGSLFQKPRDSEETETDGQQKNVSRIESSDQHVSPLHRITRRDIFEPSAASVQTSSYSAIAFHLSHILRMRLRMMSRELLPRSGPMCGSGPRWSQVNIRIQLTWSIYIYIYQFLHCRLARAYGCARATGEKWAREKENISLRSAAVQENEQPRAGGCRVHAARALIAPVLRKNK